MIYFQIYNHLDSDNDFSESETNNIENKIYYECIICLEKNTDEFKIIKLSKALLTNEENTKLVKKCSCESFIHQYCLDIWVKKGESCPICRDKFNRIIIKPIENQITYFSIKNTLFFIILSNFLKNLFTGFYVFILLTFVYNVSNYVIILVNKNI
jgi:hypothetical protein